MRTRPGSSAPAGRAASRAPGCPEPSLPAAGGAHLLLVLMVPHPRTEGLQNPPQLAGLDQTRLVDIEELEGFGDGVNVSENLCTKSGLGKVKRSRVHNQDGSFKKKRGWGDRV